MPAPGAAVCAALHEVHLPAASPLHSLPAGHEAAQLRAQSEHHLVQQADIEVSGMDYRYRETLVLARKSVIVFELHFKVLDRFKL